MSGVLSSQTVGTGNQAQTAESVKQRNESMNLKTSYLLYPVAEEKLNEKQRREPRRGIV